MKNSARSKMFEGRTLQCVIRKLRSAGRSSGQLHNPDFVLHHELQRQPGSNSWRFSPLCAFMTRNALSLALSCTSRPASSTSATHSMSYRPNRLPNISHALNTTEEVVPVSATSPAESNPTT